jgi:hypothetical protein
MLASRELLTTVGGMPQGSLHLGDAPTKLDVADVLQSFDNWFYACWKDLPSEPRTAPTDQVTCCKYQQWFATQGGPVLDPLVGVAQGRWADCPAYVRHTGGMSRAKLRALAAFRLAAHDLETETGKWGRGTNEQGQRVRAEVPRAERLCRLCCGAVGDELHMALECPCYAAVRQRHASLFTMFGGEEVVFGHHVSAARFRQWMLQDQYLVATFMYECSQRRWSDPPDDVVFAECLSRMKLISCLTFFWTLSQTLLMFFFFLE